MELRLIYMVDKRVHVLILIIMEDTHGVALFYG